MKMLVAPVPLFNREMEVDAYIIRFHRCDTLTFEAEDISSYDGATSSPLLEIIDEVGLEALTAAKPIFVPISPLMLLCNLAEQCKEPPERLIFLLERVPELPEEQYIQKMTELKALGYRFACRNIPLGTPVTAHSDYIIMSGKSAEAIPADISAVLDNIDTHEQFLPLRYGKAVLFGGCFYKESVSKGKRDISPLKHNYIRLLNLAQSDFELDELMKIVQQDTALAVSLFSIVNSLGLRSGHKIKNIQQAVAILGQTQLRKWIMTAVMGMLATDKPDEIMRLSLIRAKFAENLSPVFAMALQGPSLFLAGLFSVLDLVLDMPMSAALQHVGVSDDIHSALTDQTGKFAPVMKLVRDYEDSNWTEAMQLMIMYEISGDNIFRAYINAVSWYSQLINLNRELPEV